MNILISYSWLKEHLQTKLSAEEFAKKTTNIGNSVERMIFVADAYKHMVIGCIEAIKPHPHADRLHIVKTGIGKQTLEIVCGGSNLKEGQVVVVALPGSKVRWHGQGDWVQVQETEIRGIKSFGMICAAEEIGFEKASQGEGTIWDLTGLIKAKPGTSLVKALDLDDIVFDIEVTTNRPDAASIIGQAREGGAATAEKFLWKPSVFPALKKSNDQEVSLNITLQEPSLCPHYQAVVLDHIKVEPSPWWLQKKLLLAGYRPINNIVDITNYILHEYGQPMHAFDAEKITGQEISIRKAKKGEMFHALDGKEYTLDSTQLVIADKDKPIAIAGIMGGESTATTKQTKRIVLECATFDPVCVRQTARALNLHSNSSSLFEKGLSTEATGPALARSIELIQELAGGQVVSEVFSLRANAYKHLFFHFDPEQAKKSMGHEIPEQDMLDSLERLGFFAEKKEKIYKIRVPYWRDQDIENSVDFVEEIARVYGYEKFPGVFPQGKLPEHPLDKQFIWQRNAKEYLCGAGFTESYAYSFVSAVQLKKYGLDPQTQAVRILNPLSVDQEYMRPSLVPSMLEVIEQNQDRYPAADLFELSPIYLLSDKNDLPTQPVRLVLACYQENGEQAFFRLKGALERLSREMGVVCSFEHICNDPLWHATRSAGVFVGKKQIGVIGEVSKAVAEAFALDKRVCLADLDFKALVEPISVLQAYIPLPSYPTIKRDLAFLIDRLVEFKTIRSSLLQIDPLIKTIEFVDDYQGNGVPEGKKSLCIHVELSAPQRTLETEEAEEVIERMIRMIQETFSGIMRS